MEIMADNEIFLEYCQFCGAKTKSSYYEFPLREEGIFLCDLCAMIPQGQIDKDPFLRPIMFAFNEILTRLDK
jgi:hypothetical protein